MPRPLTTALVLFTLSLTFPLSVKSLWGMDATPDKPGGKGLGTLQDFDTLRTGPFDRGHLDSWRWSDEQRQTARKQSRLQIVEGREGQGKLLRVTIDDPEVLAREPLLLARLTPYLPPDADVVRVRLRCVTGEVRLFLGGPTAYYANSDVFTETHTVRAAMEPRWVDLDVRLDHPLRRNFRRSGFSTDAPRNYYTRWAQEPLGLYLAAGTRGEFEIDRVEAVATGEGQPFPVFTSDQIKTQAVIADFEDGRTDRIFTLYMANTETEWFEESWKREKPLRFTPTSCKVTSDGSGKYLTCSGPTAEEVHCVGIRTEGTTAANAIALRIAAEAPDRRETLVGAGPVVPIDFLVFVAPRTASFPWARFQPPAEWRAFPGPGFDYHLSYRTVQPLTDVNFAIYQTRRYLKPKDWAEVVLPAADFTCVYGTGSCRERFLKHEPLSLGDVISINWLSPWGRVGNRDLPVTFRIDDLRFVTIPGSVSEHRSFWQIPNPQAVTLTDETTGGIRNRRMVLTPSSSAREPK